MKTPIAYPFVRDSSFVSGVGPAIGAAFLNTSQDALGDLYGALLGRSATMEGEDYTTLDCTLGSLTILTNTNGGGTFHVGYQAPANASEHGLLGILANNAASGTFNAEGGQLNLALLDFIWSAKVKLTGKANLDVAGNNGFRIGIQNPPDGVAKNFTFVAGSDKANWQYVIGASGLVDTGVAATDGTWYDIQIVRLSQSATAYINGALVGTVATAFTVPIGRRKIEIKSPGLAVGDGVKIDYFKAGYQR